jgi:hypothetical protein
LLTYWGPLLVLLPLLLLPPVVFLLFRLACSAFSASASKC